MKAFESFRIRQMMCTSLVPPTPSPFILTQAHRNISLIRRRDVQQQHPRRLIRQSVTRATSSQAVIRRQGLEWAKGPGSIFLFAPYSVQQPPMGCPSYVPRTNQSPVLLYYHVPATTDFFSSVPFQYYPLCVSECGESLYIFVAGDYDDNDSDREGTWHEPTSDYEG